MSLRDVLQKIIDENMAILLSDGQTDWEAADLLNKLSDRMLKRKAHLQQGMYIAAINDAGYLGEVLYRVKQKG